MVARIDVEDLAGDAARMKAASGRPGEAMLIGHSEDQPFLRSQISAPVVHDRPVFSNLRAALHIPSRVAVARLAHPAPRTVAVDMAARRVMKP